LDIWFGLDEKCVFGAVTRRELRSRGQDLLRFADAVSSCLRNIAYIWSCSCCFDCFGYLVCSGRASSLGGTSVAGSRGITRDLREGA
jgi:hypothetical protein